MLRKSLSCMVPLLFLLVPSAPAVADTPSANAGLRCELTQFVSELSAVPATNIAPAEANQKVEALSSGDLERIDTILSTLPNWQRLPSVMVALGSADDAHSRAVLERVLQTGGEPLPGPDGKAQDLENFRTDFLFLIDQLGRFAPVLGGDFGDRVAKVRAKIVAMPAAALPALRDAYEKAAPRWQASLVTTGAAQGLMVSAEVQHLKPVSLCDTDCGIDVGCWVDAVGCLIDSVGDLANQVAGYVANIANLVNTFFNTTLPNLFNQIAALPGQVASFFTQVFNNISSFVTTQFNNLVNLLPHSVNQVLSYLGIDWNNVNWSTIASSIPTIAPPCPQQAVDIAADICDRGGDAITGLLYGLAPDDGLSFVFKAGLALIHYPLMYLCQCKDIQDAIQTADDEAAHRAWTQTHLDLQLSTRATQASVDLLNVSLTQLNGDVAHAEAKLDVLGATTDRIESNVNQIESTTGRIETNVNHIEATTNRTETKIDALTQGNTNQQGFVADFSKLMQRVNIENNLLANNPDTISQFELPTTFGGMLDTVGLITADTIHMNLLAGQNIYGAEREISRGDALRLAGDFVKAYEAYRSAYGEAVK